MELVRLCVSKVRGRALWMLFLFLLYAIFFERGLSHLNAEKQLLLQKLNELQKSKEQALLLQEDLLGRINSQNDQEWGEIVLMKNLGLVPEGQTKVFFLK